MPAAMRRGKRVSFNFIRLFVKSCGRTNQVVAAEAAVIFLLSEDVENPVSCFCGQMGKAQWLFSAGRCPVSPVAEKKDCTFSIQKFE